MTRDSADLWFRPPTSYSVASDDAGAFGSVCKPIGDDAEKLGSRLHPPPTVPSVRFTWTARCAFEQRDVHFEQRVVHPKSFEQTGASSS